MLMLIYFIQPTVSHLNWNIIYTSFTVQNSGIPDGDVVQGQTPESYHNSSSESYHTSDGYRVAVKLEGHCQDPASPEDQLSHYHSPSQLPPPHQTSMASMAYSQPPSIPASKSPYSVNGISLSAPNVDLIHPAMGYPGLYFLPFSINKYLFKVLKSCILKGKWLIWRSNSCIY